MTNKSLAAVHEAAHVVFALAMKHPVEKVEIEPHTECGEPDCWIGATTYSKEGVEVPSTPEALALYMILSLAGSAAEEHAGAQLEPGVFASPSDELEADKAAFVLAFVETPGLANSVRQSAPARAREALDVEGVWRAVLAIGGALEAAYDAGAPSLTSEDIRRVAAEHREAVERLGEQLEAMTEPPLLGR